MMCVTHYSRNTHKVFCDIDPKILIDMIGCDFVVNVGKKAGNQEHDFFNC